MTTNAFNRHPQDLDGLIEQMIEAVDEAIEEARKDNAPHSIVDGELHTTNGRNPFYTFTLRDEWEPDANTSVHVDIDPDDHERMIPGTILSVLNTTITFVTEAPLPHTALENTTLVEDTIWLLEKLRASLLLLQAQGESEEQIASKIFGLVDCQEGRGQPQIHIQGFSPDADQTQAISLGMKSERLFLIGPPGTGKTSTEDGLALEYLVEHKTVLLLAHTNVALDNAMKRLMQYCEQSSNSHLVKDHRLVRLGKTKDLVGAPYHDITLQGIVDQQLGHLVAERDALQQEQSDLEDRIVHLERDLELRSKHWSQKKEVLQMHLAQTRAERELLEQQENSRLQPIRMRLTAIEKEQQTILIDQQQAKKQVRTWTRELDGDVQQVGKIALRTASQQVLRVKQHALLLFQAQPWWKRLLDRFDGMTLTSLTAEVAQADLDVMNTKQAVLTCEQNRDAYVGQVTQLAEKLKILQSEEQGLLVQQQMQTPTGKRIMKLTTQIEQDEQAVKQGDAAITVAQEDLEQCRLRHVQVVTRLEDIEGEERTLTAGAVDHALLLGATLTAITTNPYLRIRKCDAVIIDEASMASMPLVLVAVAHAIQHANIVGDPTQLAPIVKLKDRHAKPRAAYWLGTDIFSHLGVILADADAHRNQVVLLSQQSRMLPEIAAPDSSYIYGGRLKNRPDTDRVSYYSLIQVM